MGLAGSQGLLRWGGLTALVPTLGPSPRPWLRQLGCSTETGVTPETLASKK